jgi:tetratricopeptide (TPR) repeat protein
MSDDAAALLRMLAMDHPLDTETIRDGFMRSVRAWDTEAQSTLLTRYLGQPLSDSETAWAYMNLANALACGDRAAAAVETHETFETWLPGKSPRLSFTFPYYASSAGLPDTAMGPDEIRVQFLGQSVEFATAYGAVSRYNDYVSKVDAALARLTSTKDNAELRFFAVRIYASAAEIAGDFDRAERYSLAMHAIADEAVDAETMAELHATAHMAEIQLARAKNDGRRIEAKIAQALSLLDELDHSGPSRNAWVRGYRHELAHHLTLGGRYDLALPLLDAVLATGEHFGGGYGWLMHAKAVWQVTHDRPRTLALLRDARAHDGRDLVGMFRCAAFDDVQDDPEFLHAISRSAAT